MIILHFNSIERTTHLHLCDHRQPGCLAIHAGKNKYSILFEIVSRFPVVDADSRIYRQPDHSRQQCTFIQFIFYSGIHILPLHHQEDPSQQNDKATHFNHNDPLSNCGSDKYFFYSG